ncbi:MAG: AbrB/MazE/SpoVT family DNA-binding domain-containing protein [Pseudomonadota bacterium]
MPISTISAKGQITLPAHIRKKLGLKPNDRVLLETMNDAIVIRRAADFFELEGFLGKALPGDEEKKTAAKAIFDHLESSDQ